MIRWRIHLKQEVRTDFCHCWQGGDIVEFIARCQKSGKISKHLALILWFGEMYVLYICTYVLKDSYVDSPFLSLLIV